MSEPRVIEERVLCKGKRFSLAQLLVEYEGRVFTRDLLKHPGAVAILAVFTSDSSTLLLRQWRPGCRCWLWEVPARTMEEGESPEETATRELEEETGYRPERLEKLGVIYTTPGTSSEIIHVYLAVDPKPSKQRLEEDEVLTVHRIPLREAYAMLARGEIRDAKTVAALALYAARMEWLTPSL